MAGMSVLVEKSASLTLVGDAFFFLEKVAHLLISIGF